MKKDNNFDYSAQSKLGVLDTEYNNNNKNVAKSARNNGLKLGAIAAEQFSRKGRSDIDDTLFNQLLIDCQQLQRTRSPLTGFDLGGCYDCINNTAADLALQRIGDNIRSLRAYIWW